MILSILCFSPLRVFAILRMFGMAIDCILKFNISFSLSCGLIEEIFQYVRNIKWYATFYYTIEGIPKKKKNFLQLYNDMRCNNPYFEYTAKFLVLIKGDTRETKFLDFFLYNKMC